MSLNLSSNELTLLPLFLNDFIPSCIVCPSEPFILLPSILFVLKSLFGLFLRFSMSLNLSFNELKLLPLFLTALIPSCTVCPSNPFVLLAAMLFLSRSLFWFFLKPSMSLNLSPGEFKLLSLFLNDFIPSCTVFPSNPFESLSSKLFLPKSLFGLFLNSSISLNLSFKAFKLAELFLSSSISLNLSFIVFKSASLSLLAFIWLGWLSTVLSCFLISESFSLLGILFLSFPSNIPDIAPPTPAMPKANPFPNLGTNPANNFPEFNAPLATPYPAIKVPHELFNPASIPNILSTKLGPSITAIAPPTINNIFNIPLLPNPLATRLLVIHELYNIYILVNTAVINITINMYIICFTISFNLLPSLISANASNVIKNLLNANSNNNLITFNIIQTNATPMAPREMITDIKSILYL